jgi:hypothetical protein
LLISLRSSSLPASSYRRARWERISSFGNIQDEVRSLIELAGLAAVFDEVAERGARS